MTKIKTLSRATISLAAALIMMGVAPAAALSGPGGGTHNGDSTTGSPPTTTTTTPSTTGESHNSGAVSPETPKPPTFQQRIDTKKAELKADTTQTENQPPKDPNHTELQQKGEGILAEMRKEHGDKTKTPEERKQQCEAHKQGLTQKFSNISANALKMQTRIDGVFAKGQAYADANPTSKTTDYLSLVDSATAARTASDESITALKAVTPTIDCNNTSVASDIAKFKAAAQDTRDKLKAYKTAVKALLQSLQIPKPEAPSTTTTPTGGTN